MTAPIIAHLRKLHEAATPGPWRIHSNPRFWVELPVEGDGRENRDNDAAFVVAQRNTLPEVLAVLEAAEALIPANTDRYFCGDEKSRAFLEAIRALRALEVK